MLHTTAEHITMKQIFLPLLLIFLTYGIFCAAPAKSGIWITSGTVDGSIDDIPGSTSLYVYLPAGYSVKIAKRFPLVIALHGWDHSPALWRQKSDLGTLADTYGFVIAMPNMGRTIYESSFYPETAGLWKTAPGSRWIGEAVLPHMRKRYSVYTNRAHTAVIGYSTGGRGALLVAEMYPEFAFVGSLSGTFDLMRLKTSEGEYRIHEIIYGKRDVFPDRWIKDNCITPGHLAKLAGTQLFIGHGSMDKSVNPNQLDALRNALKGTSVNVSYTLVPDAVHDWNYWNSQWPDMFAAMAAVIAK